MENKKPKLLLKNSFSLKTVDSPKKTIRVTCLILKLRLSLTYVGDIFVTSCSLEMRRPSVETGNKRVKEFKLCNLGDTTAYLV